MLRTTLLFIHLFIPLLCSGQQIMRSVICSAGYGEFTSGIKTHSTLGETFIGTSSVGTVAIRQGFQQPNISHTENQIYDCTIEQACNYNPEATTNDGSCLFYDACGICDGDGTSCDILCNDNNDILSALGGCVNAIELLGCETLWDGTSLSELCPESCGSCECMNDYNSNGICDEDDVFGCTYFVAINYNDIATADDGSCLFEEENNCVADLNEDGLIGLQDLLVLLAGFGTTCE